ncbi:MAG: hypothetical protein JF587_05845 [Catenulisporales bacterium]|nr:hypothetical protein [Catenulisporales bacterium]
MPDEPLPLLPRLPLRSLDDLARCADEIHSDRCQWLGADSPRPCTCGVPKALRALAAAERSTVERSTAEH